MPSLQIPHKLEPFLLKPKRFKVAYGGRGGGKSHSFADMLIYLGERYRHRIGCFREYQNSIDDSVYALLADEVRRLKVPGYKINRTTIDHKDGGSFRFKGLARNPESVKSMHGFTRFWIEEAQTISSVSLQLLTPTLREDDSEIWLSLNPQSSADPVSQRFLKPFENELLKNGFYEDDLHYIVEINYMDNPWFPESLELERQFDYDNLPRSTYNHIWLGQYNDSIENAIILPEWFDAAVNAHERLGWAPRGVKVLAHDPSDMGADDKSNTLRHGSYIEDVEIMETGDSNEGLDWALSRAVQEQVDLFVWDGDGLGASLKRQVSDSLDGTHIDYEIFKGSESPERPNDTYQPVNATDLSKNRTNKKVFKNKRAQFAGRLRDKYFNTYMAVVKKKYVDPDDQISINPNIERLNQFRAETCRIPQKYNSNGLFQLMSKPEMLRLKIVSPNMFDSSMMSLVVPQFDTDMGAIEFESPWGYN